MSTILVIVADQRILSVGHDCAVEVTLAGYAVRAESRALLTAEEAEAYAASGGEANFLLYVAQFEQIVNVDMPEWLGPYEE